MFKASIPFGYVETGTIGESNVSVFNSSDNPV